MTPVLTVETIQKFLEAGLENLRPEGDLGTERKITVYRYNLPDPAPAAMTQTAADGPDSYEGMMPAVIVCPVSFEDKAFMDGSSLLAVSLMAGVFSRDNMNADGPWAVMNILERIRRLLLTYRVIEGACEIQEPLGWQLYDDSTKPLWFGEMMTQWRILVPDRIDPEDWRGDFLKEMM
ncbi:MAG: hypothetical protein LBS67_02170 [Clostridiales Family XIII bacterium]|jgi:hypothetical protein|nr:hypothetical protein [Clostridiales Family XIII bacterium]